MHIPRDLFILVGLREWTVLMCALENAAMLLIYFPDCKVHGANMGPIWGQQNPGGPHVGPMTLLSGLLIVSKSIHFNQYSYIYIWYIYICNCLEDTLELLTLFMQFVSKETYCCNILRDVSPGTWNCFSSSKQGVVKHCKINCVNCCKKIS